MAFDSAVRYTAESIEKCRQMASFLKKRQQIEEEYALALRKLCKSVALQPLRKNTNWLGKTKLESNSEDEAQLLKTTLWSTFYEIVDDTSQISKSHNTLAEALQTQIIEPLQVSIKEMESSRKALVDEGTALEKEVNDAQIVLRKAKQHLDDCSLSAAESKSNYELIVQQSAPKPKDLEKAKLKAQCAHEKCMMAKQSHRQCEEACKAFQAKFNQIDIPRMLHTFKQMEGNRCAGIQAALTTMVEQEKKTAEMNGRCAMEMGERLKQIHLPSDDRLFHETHIGAVQYFDPLMLSNNAPESLIRYNSAMMPSAPPLPLNAAGAMSAAASMHQLMPQGQSPLYGSHGMAQY